MKRLVSAILAIVLTASLLLTFEASANVLGDFNGSGTVTSDDAVYLLRYTLFPEYYPVFDFADFDHNDMITSDDAVYLLRFTLFPEYYPLTGEEGISLKGETIVFLVENGSSGVPSAEIMPDEELSPGLAGYVKLRNDTLEESLGVIVTEIRTDDMYSELRNAALDAPGFDIAMPYLQDAALLAPEGVFCDLYGFGDMIDFYAPYWDQNAVAGLSIGEKLYMMTGDISLSSMDAASCVFYNKRIVDDYGLEDPYNNVCCGTWTYDRMYETASSATRDLDGDGEITYNDTVGLYIGHDYANAMYFGAGARLVKKDETDLPALALGSERQYEIAAKLFYFYHNRSFIRTESIDPAAISGGYDDCRQVARDRLANDMALFVTGTVRDVYCYKECTDADIRPAVTPKWDEEQESYHTYVDPTRATVCAIPATHPDPEKAAFALETVCAASADTVRQGYYEWVSDSLRYERYEADDMLNIIFESRVYDLGAICDWAELRAFIPGFCAGDSQDFASMIDARKDLMEYAIQSYIDSFPAE